MAFKTTSSNRLFSLNDLAIFLLFLVILVPSRNTFALPALFQDELVKSGLNQPTSMAFLPDGRVLITQKFGQIFVLDPRVIAPVLEPYLTITDINTGGERGLLDIVLDPAFPAQPYIYVVYHRESDKRIFISRFTHQGNTASIGSEFVVWKDPGLFSHPFHHGGGLSFGPDGHLYLTTGEQFNGLVAQDYSKAGGKIIRVARDGTIPSDNPYVGPNGKLDEIWAAGLRNPFRARWDLGTTGSIGPRLFIGEVGGNLNDSNEDIHIGKKGANYGWPYCKGMDCSNSTQAYDAPLFTYEHLSKGASVIGGIVYHGNQFPDLYSGVYFYGDYSKWVGHYTNRGIIRYLTFDNNGAFSTDNAFLNGGAGLVVDIKEGRDGALYYLEIASSENFIANTGALNRIIYNDGNQAPQITSTTANITHGGSPLIVQFSALATDVENDNLQYLWVFGDGAEAEGADVTHTYTTNGTYQATVQVSDTNKTTTSNPAITITVGAEPQVTITQPIDGATFRAGETINFSATATDDGVLTEDDYKWSILFVHNRHTHPEQGPITGSSGSLHTPNSGHSFFDETGFEVSIEVTDQDGVSTNKRVRIFPEKVDIAFNSQPNGISFFIDGTIITTPIVYDTAIGFIHNLTAPQTTCLNGNQKYNFVSWSNGATASHNYTIPDHNETLTANYVADGICDANTNLPPLAFTDEITMANNATRIINVLENDTDSDSNLDKSTVTTVRQPQHGQISVDNVTGFITYSHDGSAMTKDSFTYTVKDEQGVVSNEASVLIDITGTDTGDGTVTSCGSGLELDGINDWVNIPNLTLPNDFTIESWVKLAPGIDNKDALFGQEGAGPDINFSAGKVRLYAYGNRVVANTALLPDTWGHVAITRSGSNLKLYINGVEDATGRWNGSLNLKSIGRGNRGYFGGMMDEIRVWELARTEAEISASYDSNIDPRSTGLIGYWSFNETDQTVTDLSDLENHASLGTNLSTGSDDPVRLSSNAPFTESCDGNNNEGNTAPAANAGADQVVIDNNITLDGGLSSDPDGDNLTYSWRENSNILGSGQSINHFFDVGTHVVTLTVNDGKGHEASDTVSITVNENVIDPINIAPIAQGDTVTLEVGGVVTINVLTNDSDSDGNMSPTSVVIVTAPTNGMATVNPSGTVTYSSNTGTTATEDTLTYTVADTSGLTSGEATVTITITQTVPDNLPPIVVEDMATVQAGGAVTIDVLANDSDSDGTLDISSLLIVSEPSSGAVDIDFITGVITYTHDGTTSTSDSFSYTVEDDLGAVSSEAIVTVSITQDPVVASCGKGIELDGINDWINIPNLSLNDFTIEGWFNLAPGIDFKDPLFGQEGSGPDIHFTAGRVRLFAYGIRITARTPLIADTWGHIAITRSGSNLTVYINGVKDATGRWNGAFSIKAIGRGNRGFVKGKMDEIRIWDIARTETEISSSYDTTVDANSAGLIGYWSFNDTDQIVTDASSSENHGSLGVSTASGADDPVRLDSTAPLNENCGDPDPDPVPPIANNDTVNPIEIGESISFSVTDNDEDTDNSLDLSSVEIVSTPSAGNTTVNTDGTITYQHTGDTATTDTLTYTVKDTEGLISNAATVTIAVTEDIISYVPPIAVDDAVGPVEAGATIDFTVTDNDTDADGNINPASVLIVTAPTNGVATVNLSGTITYTSNTGTTATEDTLTYTVADTANLISNEATVTITITPTEPDNLPPVAVEDTAIVQAGEAVTIDILANDSADGTLDIASVAIVSVPTYGLTAITSSGSITYTSTTGTTATEDTLTYTVADTEGLSSNETIVTITITPTEADNLPPVVVEDTATVQAGEAVTIDILANDSDSDGTLDISSLLIVSEPSSGAVDIDFITGAITYTHDGTTSTSDSFSYTIEDDLGAVSSEATITVSITQDPVVGSCGKGIELDGINDWINIPNLSLNDFTIEGWFNLAPGIDYKDPLFGQEGSGPDIHFTAGRVRLFAYGIRVTARTALIADTWGHIAITRSGSNLTVYVNGVKDATGRWNGAFSIKAIGRGNRGFVKGEMDEIRIWDIARTETEISSSYDTTVDANSAGLIGYWSFNDTDQIVTDASSSANHGSLGASTASGADDPVRLDSTAPLNENCGDPDPDPIPPVANNDTVNPIEIRETISFSVTDNDEETDNTLDLSSVEIVSTPSAGNTTVNTDGTITYQHTGDTATTDTLTYTIKDTDGLVSNEATVTFTITKPINVAPTANDDPTVSVEVGKTISFSVTGNDEDIDGNIDSSSVEIVSTSSEGDATVNADGTITYQHTGDAATTDTLTYTVKDTEGLISNAATVTIAVTEDIIIYVPPIAVDDAVGPVEAGATIDFTVTDNDTDADGNINPASVLIVTAPTNGAATVNLSGTITYTSNTGTTATEDTLTYTVANTANLISNEATVTITITPSDPDSPPLAVDDTTIVQAGEAATIDVLANDSVSGGTLNKSTLLIVNAPSSGTVEIDTATGIITYTHDGSTSTSDSFSYTVEDDKGEISNEAIVTLSITQDPVVGSCGKGIELDGINDWINIPNLSLANDFTVEGWVKLAPGIDNNDALFGQEGQGPDINFYASKVRLYAAGDKVTANTALLPNTWEHIAITRSGTHLVLYINGIEDATGTWNGTLSLKAIGRGNRGYLKGELDEIRVWNIARTATEISNSYNATIDLNSAGLIGYWGFNDAGQIITDASSSANHGSLGANTAVGTDDPVHLDSTAPFLEDCTDENTGGNTNSLNLHGLFSDHGVLQRGIEVPVWGTAKPGATVDVTFSGQSKSIVADNNGQWMVKLDPLAANATGDTMIVTSEGQTETREDILVGEVWLASGQSNMAMAMFVADPFNPPTSIPSEYGDASFTPSVRVLQMKVGSTSNQPSKVLSNDEKWKLSDKEGINYFSAVAYYFGRNLNQELNVPVGIITGTAGGTSVRGWIPDSLIESSACNDTSIASVNYNYSIAPLLPYALKGVIWYQGEGNAKDQVADCYHDDFKILIESWRSEWATAANSANYDFPFYFVQLPNYEAGDKADAWVKIREQMLEVNLDTPRTEMVVTIDVGDANDVHPRLKLPVGKRLARIARAIDYGENIVYSGPLYKSIEISGDAAILSFDHVGGGLVSSDNQPLKYFEIAGADGVYYDAVAIILGNTVQVTSNSVSAPVKVRYAWHTNPEDPNFSNVEGLMATPFRTDATFFNTGGNLAPLANNDTVGPVQAGSSISFTVTDNDVDSDGNMDPASVSILSLPSEGTTTIDATGTITYTSAGTTTIIDTFTYTVADTQGAVSNEASVSITVTDIPTTSVSKFYVATNGDDTNLGTAGEPFKTLEKARSAVVAYKQASGLPDQGMTVVLREGIYQLDQTLNFGAADSGSEGKPIVYKSENGENAIITGSQTLDPTKFALVDSNSPIWNRLDNGAKSKVMQIDLGEEGISNFGLMEPRNVSSNKKGVLHLYFDNKPMTLARWPDKPTEDSPKNHSANENGFTHINQAISNTQFTYNTDRANRWTQANDVWLHGFFKYNWADYHVPISNLNIASKTMTITQPGAFGISDGQPFYAYNLLEEITEPGEWYLDRNSGILYFWPPENISNKNVSVSMLDTNLIEFNNASWITFKDVVIEGSRAGLIKMAGGSHNLIQGSILRNSGSVGAILDGTKSGIRDSEISYTGEGAIIVKGGNRSTLQKSENFVKNNDIHHFGHFVYGYKSGIKVKGVGQKISNNTLYQSPHVAIQWEGNEHLIEKNEIHDVTRFSSDAGAMYSGREWGWRGNVIRHNFIHDIHSWIGHGEFHVYGIYLDDALSGTTIFGNVFYDIQGFAILSGGGRDNIMENNIFAHCGASLFADNRGVNSINFTPNHSWNFIGKLERDGIDYKAEPWASTYPELAEIPKTFAIQDPSVRWPHPEGSTFKRNISFGGTPHSQITNGIYDFDKVGSPGYSPISYFKEVADNIDGQNPLFVNEAALNLNLQSNSPAFSIPGFESIPFDQIGVQ